MMSPDENHKNEIIISNETKNLASFSSTKLLARGQKLADLVIVKSPLADKIKNILLKEYSSISTSKTRSMLYHKIKLAIALLEIQNKPTENWAVDLLYEELENLDAPIYPPQRRESLQKMEVKNEDILNQKQHLVQAIFKAGKQKIASEYALNKTRNSWDGKGFPVLFKGNLNIFSDMQMGEVIKILSKADKDGKILFIENLVKYNCKQGEVVSYLQDIVANDTNPSLQILACEALINLGKLSRIVIETLLLISRRDDPFKGFANFLLEFATNSQEQTDRGASLLFETISKEKNIFWLSKYISYVPKAVEREWAITTLLGFLSSTGLSEKDITRKRDTCIKELINLSYRGNGFLDKLIELSVDSKRLFKSVPALAILEFEDINEIQSKKLLALAQPSQKWLDEVTAAGILANFNKTEKIGAELLVRYVNEKSILLNLASEIFVQNKRLAFNSKFLRFLYDLPDKSFRTGECMTVIKMIKKAEQ